MKTYISLLAPIPLQDDAYEPYNDNDNVSRRSCLTEDDFIVGDTRVDENELSWDEEENGDRVIYDDVFEMNADLTPWNLVRQDEMEEVYGLYV